MERLGCFKSFLIELRHGVCFYCPDKEGKMNDYSLSFLLHFTLSFFAYCTFRAHTYYTNAYLRAFISIFCIFSPAVSFYSITYLWKNISFANAFLSKWAVFKLVVMFCAAHTLFQQVGSRWCISLKENLHKPTQAR